MQNSKFKIHSLFLLLGFLGISLVFTSCSIPSLESPQCTKGRDVVREFYSFHFGNDMHPSPENLKAREKFLTNELFTSLSGSNDTATDYFTATDNYPKAFRVGQCKDISDEKVVLQIVLLWRNNEQNEQKEVYAETVKTGDKWLINKVSTTRP